MVASEVTLGPVGREGFELLWTLGGGWSGVEQMSSCCALLPSGLEMGSKGI